MDRDKTKIRVPVVVLLALLGLGGCTNLQEYPSADTLGAVSEGDYDYLIGPGDVLDIFVWRNPDVSAQGIPVRPDGKVSSPLVEDLQASGKTSNQIAREIELILAEYIKDPLVTVTVVNFVGGYAEQIRVVGEAINPSALPYRTNMSLLDVMIQVGGLTDFAAGNKARLIRTAGGDQRQVTVRLDDLLQGGDMTANVQMAPGDVLIIPQALF